MIVRNGERFIAAALESLAAQTFRDFEIVLVENGSTDRTAQIAADWARREPRLRLFHLREPRLARVRNFAASQARAPLLAKLDGDDIAFPARLELQHEAMAARPSLGVLGTAAALLDPDGKTIGRLQPPPDHRALVSALEHASPLVHSTLMIRADLFRRVGGYREGLNVAEDYDLLSRLAERAEIGALPDVLAGYRVHRASVTQRQPARLAVASACVAAAAGARRAGRPEPFRSGVPALREAELVLGLGRGEARRRVRLAVCRSIFSRSWLLVPLPAPVKQAIRATAIRLRLRPLYVGALSLIDARRASRRAERLSVRPLRRTA